MMEKLVIGKKDLDEENNYNKTLNAKLRIFAGLCIWRMPTAEEMQIRCEKLESGEICYGKLVKIKKSKDDQK